MVVLHEASSIVLFYILMPQKWAIQGRPWNECSFQKKQFLAQVQLFNHDWIMDQKRNYVFMYRRFSF